MKNLSKYSWVIPISGLLFLNACKVSKDIALPDMALSKNYRFPAIDTFNSAAIPWQIFFKDETLQTLITNAIQHNNNLEIAIKNIDIASLTLKQAKLGNVPSIGIQAAAAINRPSDNSLSGISLNTILQTNHIQDYTVFSSLSWEADIWGKIKSQKAAALDAYLNTAEARNAIQTILVNDVSKSYYNLLMLDAQLVIALKNVQLNDSTLRIIQLQYQAGQVTSLAVQQADAQRLTAATLVPKFEQQISIEENALSILTGQLPNAIKRKNELSSTSLDTRLTAGIPSDLLRLRPDVKQYELSLSEANANVGYAKANMYPSLTITAQAGLDAFKASNWFNIPASLFGNVLGSFAQPLINKKKLKTQFEIAKVRREQAVIQFRQAVLQAVGEVSDELVKLDKLKLQQALVSERVITLQTATRNAQLLFQNGLATYIEVITAQGNVLQSELELATIQKQRLDAGADLYRALGGGWNN